ncbi:hypothetical protein U8V72_23180 [Priestia filamentosa]|uniref:toprim domain-containing protein n=1 Tax=Priestia filamentosa TaxID=1402861 RepID=UPI00058904A1
MGFVVEGFHDETKVLKVVPHSHVVVTKGTRFDNRVRMDVEEALQKCSKVFLLTDPNEAGELLANTLLNEFPMLERVLLDKKECLSYRKNRVKVGVEHCSNEYLHQVLRNYL